MNFWATFPDFQLVLSLVTVIYYFYIIVVMITSKSTVFRSAFFTIFIFTGIFDIMGILALEWVKCDLRTGFGPKFELVTRITAAITGTNFFTHIIGCFLMTVNRYTAACHPESYCTFWSRKVVCVLLVIDVLLSYGVHSELFFIRYVYAYRGDYWVLVGRERKIPEIRIMSAIASVLYELLSFILIARTLYAIRTKVNTTQASQDYGLVVVATISCALDILECIFEISTVTGLDTKKYPIIDLIHQHYTFCVYLILSMNAYSIMLLSRPLRQAALRFCRSRKISATSMGANRPGSASTFAQRRDFSWTR